jgi:hypothetical protein
MKWLLQTLSIASVVMLGACGSESEPQETVAVTQQPSVTATKAAADPTAKMARAVGDGKPGAAVEIRYEILDKPEVGKPTQIEIAFIPRAGVDSLDATMSGMEGITVAGDLKAHFEKVEPGKPYEHTFSLLPDKAGVYYVTVSVTTGLGGASIGRTFSIPFVVGASEVQQKASPAKDASGQAIESMKAQESR